MFKHGLRDSTSASGPVKYTACPPAAPCTRSGTGGGGGARRVAFVSLTYKSYHMCGVFLTLNKRRPNKLVGHFARQASSNFDISKLDFLYFYLKIYIKKVMLMFRV